MQRMDSIIWLSIVIIKRFISKWHFFFLQPYICAYSLVATGLFLKQKYHCLGWKIKINICCRMSFLEQMLFCIYLYQTQTFELTHVDQFLIVNLTSFFLIDLQCHVSFRCTAQWFSYIYIYIYIYIYRFFSLIGYYKILNIVPCAIQ